MSRFFKPSFPSLNRKRSRRSIFKEEFDPDNSVSDTLGLGVMPASPTPREVRRLASDHDFVMGALSSPRRLGWWAFLATHLSLVTAFGAGAIFIIVAIIYANTISRQPLDCPTWANDCSKSDDWTTQHLATIQGIITLIYLVGLSALAFVALALCESAVWPLLTKQSFTIGGLEAYLATTRGSVPSLPAAATSVKTAAAGFVLAAATIVTLVPLASPALVGFAFTPTGLLTQLASNYTRGGGMAELYAQTDPPTSVLAGVLAEYYSWSTNPASEPLPGLRDWYIDREVLSQRGDFSAHAVKLETSVSCTPYKAQQLNRNGILWSAFLTNMTRTNSNSSDPNDKHSSAEVWVRSIPQLTLWADNFDFISPHHTRTTLVFAALGGKIEGGSASAFVSKGVTDASTIACIVDITAADRLLTSGPNAPSSSAATLSSLDTLLTSASAKPGTKINEILLWFAVAPLMAGSSVDGTQPMFFNSTLNNRAVPYTSSAAERNVWTIDGIKEFILLSIGALAQATSGSGPSPASAASTQQTIISNVSVRKLDPSRSLLLILLPGIVMAIMVGVACWTAQVHKRGGVPVMRLFDVGEVLKSAQTSYLRQRGATDAAKPYLPNELGAVEVRYGVDKDGIAGLAKGVRGFRESVTVV